MSSCARSGQVVFHLELFVAHGATKGSQVERHVHVLVRILLCENVFPTVAQKDLILVTAARPSGRPTRDTCPSPIAEVPARVTAMFSCVRG